MLALVVDDSQTIRRLLSHALHEMGATEVLEAESADKALMMLRFCNTVDLILTDWHMPGMSGLEFLVKLRGRTQFARTPIIMTTSEASGENVVAALRAGATNYIIKPFNMTELATKVMPFIHSAGLASKSSGSLTSVSHSGKLGDGDIGSLFQFLIQMRKTGRCEVEFVNSAAYVYIESGKIIGAVHQSETAETAFYTCFCMPIKCYRFRDEISKVPPGCEITLNSTALLLEAVSRRDTLLRSNNA